MIYYIIAAVTQHVKSVALLQLVTFGHVMNATRNYGLFGDFVKCGIFQGFILQRFGQILPGNE